VIHRSEDFCSVVFRQKGRFSAAPSLLALFEKKKMEYVSCGPATVLAAVFTSWGHSPVDSRYRTVGRHDRRPSGARLPNQRFRRRLSRADAPLSPKRERKRRSEQALGPALLPFHPGPSARPYNPKGAETPPGGSLQHPRRDVSHRCRPPPG